MSITVDLVSNVPFNDDQDVFIAYGKLDESEIYVAYDTKGIYYDDKYYPFEIHRKYMSECVTDDENQEYVCITGFEYEIITFDELITHMKNTIEYGAWGDNFQNFGNFYDLSRMKWHVHNIVTTIMCDYLDDDFSNLSSVFSKIREHIGVNDDGKPDSVIAEYTHQLEKSLKPQFKSNFNFYELKNTLLNVEAADKLVDRDFFRFENLEKILEKCQKLNQSLNMKM